MPPTTTPYSQPNSQPNPQPNPQPDGAAEQPGNVIQWPRRQLPSQAVRNQAAPNQTAPAFAATPFPAARPGAKPDLLARIEFHINCAQGHSHAQAWPVPLGVDNASRAAEFNRRIRPWMLCPQCGGITRREWRMVTPLSLMRVLEALL